MVTETVVLDKEDGSWRSVVNTQGTIIIAGMTGAIRLRFGISSTSEGMILEEEDTITATETVYIQPMPKTTKRQYGFITVYVHKG